ncbi:MAG: hypothetical protein H6Q90_2348 [Deltaproteobacteria bacterium]|nr:hypothetical protein [Deltaproteobacteria bacterium]
MRRLGCSFVLAFAACGGAPHRAHTASEASEAVPEDDHWETVTDRKLVHAERCGVGPFEVVFPARQDTWGRRVVMLIHGPRKLKVASRFDGIAAGTTDRMTWQTGLGFPTEPEGDHSRCRSPTGPELSRSVSVRREARIETSSQRGSPLWGAPPIGGNPAGVPVGGRSPGAIAAVVPVTTRPGGPTKPGKPSKPGKVVVGKPPGEPAPPARRYASDLTSAELATLQVYTGDIVGMPKPQAAAYGWLPRGNPLYYADEYWTSRSTTSSGTDSIRIRFWFEEPADLEGVVFEFLDQQLTPDLPIAEYQPRFEARVQAANARREASRPPPPACKTCAQDELNARVLRCNADESRDECTIFHRRGDRMPPPRKPEIQPRAPGPGVDWIAGYWMWSEDLVDFVWIEGTYVVRAPVVAAAPPEPTPLPAPVAIPAPPPAPTPPPVTVVAPEPIVEPPREVSVSLPPAPAARVEVIAPPPPLTGALWIPGHWELLGATWRWSPGRWVQPPRAGERFRAPAIQLRGKVRVYLPGRWIRVR